METNPFENMEIYETIPFIFLFIITGYNIIHRGFAPGQGIDIKPPKHKGLYYIWAILYHIPLVLSFVAFQFSILYLIARWIKPEVLGMQIFSVALLIYLLLINRISTSMAHKDSQPDYKKGKPVIVAWNIYFALIGLLPLKAMIYLFYTAMIILNQAMKYELLPTLPHSINLFLEVNQFSIILLISLDRISNAYKNSKKRLKRHWMLFKEQGLIRPYYPDEDS